MADMTRIKGRIAETIYPNGTGAITAESHQALLLEMMDDINTKKADQSELVATQKSLDALEQKVDNLPQGGGDVKADGVYPDLTAGDLAGRGESVPAEFGFRASGGKSIKDGRAYIKRIKGNSVVWNQLYKPLASVIRTQVINGVTFSVYEDGTIEANGTAEGGSAYLTLMQYTNFLASHKYILIAVGAPVGKWNNQGFYFTGISGLNTSSMIGAEGYKIFQPSTDGESGLNLTCWEGYSLSCKFRPFFCDLTQMFGAGNEPTTIEEFNARVATLGVDMNAYNEGQVIHCNTESIKSVGDNAWDEEWRNGLYASSTGEYAYRANSMCNANAFRILPNEEYWVNVNTEAFFFCYDEDMQFIKYLYAYKPSKILTPANAAYMNFYCSDAYGSTYKKDILISLYHSGWKAQKDDQYQPYWQYTLPLPIIRKYFLQGMKSAGSAHDEIRFNKESGKWEMVEAIGTRAYQEGDADNASYLTDGKVTCYPLAEPIVTELDAEDQNFRDYYNVADFGTEQSQSSVPSAPFSADIIYQFNAVDMIREHELEITELQSVIATMQAQLTSLINGGQ